MSASTIRPYRPEDVDQVLGVWERASRVGHSFLPESFFPRERGKVETEYLPSARTWTSELRGRVIGFVSLVGGEVGGLFVEPEYHRRGVGRALLEFVQSVEAKLELDVFERNPAARAFYERCGFAVISRRLDAETGEHVLRMRYPQDRAD